MTIISRKRVLILNHDYSPIGICNVQKAFILVFLKKADLVAEVESFKLRSVDQQFPLPAVVKLSRYVNVPYKGVVLSRQNIFKRDANACQYCESTKDLTLDHLIPRSKGGKSNWTNLVTACKRCNASKGDRTPEQAGMKLKRRPFKPSYIMFIREFSGYVQEEWKPFLQTKREAIAV